MAASAVVQAEDPWLDTQPVPGSTVSEVSPKLTFEQPTAAQGATPHFVHNRDSIPERPDIVFPFDGRYELTTRADVGGSPGSVRVSRSALAGNLIFGPEHNLQISLPVDWETSTYSFRNADPLIPGGVNRFRNVQQIVFAPNVEAKIDDNWGIFGGGLLIDAGQYDAERTMTYGGFAGAIWRPDKTFTLRLGVAVRTRLSQEAQIAPAFWMEWKIDERTRLTSQGNNIRFEYDFHEAWCFKLDAAYEQRAYRFDTDGPGPGAVLRDDQVPITARIEFVPHAATRFEAWVGCNASRTFTVDLGKDNRFSRSHAAPSLLFGVSFDIIF